MNIPEVFKRGDGFHGVAFLSPNRWFFIFAAVYPILIVVGALARLGPGNNFFKDSSYLGSLLVYPPILFLVSLAVLKKIGVDFKLALRDWAANIKKDVLLGLMYFCAYLFLVWLLSAVGLERFMQNSRAAEIQGALSGRPFLLYAVTFSVLVLAPVGEEIFFKRLLYVGVRREKTVLKSILVCSVLFVLLHPRSSYLSMMVFVPATYYMYERYQRLSANIILHSLINLAAVFDKFF